MSILSFPTNVRSRSAGTFLQALAAFGGRLSFAWHVRKANRSMHLLSDEMLRDIGVSRSEIEDVTRHGRPVRR